MTLVDVAFASIPLWLLGILIFCALFAASLIGTELRLRWRKEGEGGGDSEGYLLSAALALLGLLIAFTFSLALSRYDSRRELVVTEANAIGTAWLRAGLAGDAAGPRLQAQIARYADIRLRLPERGQADAVEQATGRAQAELWAAMRTAIADVPPPVAATIVSATNEMFDVASARKAEREARIPGRVIEVLMLYALMSAAIVGYVLGRSGRRHRLVTAVLFILLTLALLLILDLDRPWSGAITVSQQPLIDARATMR